MAMRVRTQWQAEVVAAALALYPPRMRDRLTCDVFEADPIFAGIHAASVTPQDDGRSLSDVAHACYPWHITDKRTTIVLPRRVDVPVMVHELAHILHWSLDFDVEVEPVTLYATTNSREAFAEWVTALLIPSYLPWGTDQAWCELAKGDGGKQMVAGLMEKAS